MKNNSCAVSSTSKNKKLSCFSKQDLLDLTSYYNTCAVSHCKINPSGKHLTVNGTKSELLNNLLHSLKIKDEKDIVKFDFGKGNKYKLKYLIYKRSPVKRPNGWLDTSDIDTILFQHFEGKKDDIYFGAVPSDYHKIYPEKFQEFYKIKKRKYIVFNTDPMSKPGAHWVSVYISEDNHAEFFDSNGTSPNKYIRKFLDKFDSWSYNTKAYQNTDGLCGVYAAYFLLQKLRGKRLNLSESSADSKMVKKRKEYFV